MYFHEFCDVRAIPEESRTPISTELMQAFLAVLIGSFSLTAVKNASAAVQAWHRIHGIGWFVEEGALDPFYRAARACTPKESRRTLRKPASVPLLEQIRSRLNMTTSRDIAFFACLTTVFWATARLGEFVTPTVDGFRAGAHVTPADVSVKEDGHGNRVTNFRLPRTKVAPAGEDVFWARQFGPADPEAALAAHMEQNAPPADGPLFAYRVGHRHESMSRVRFLTRLKQVCAELGVEAPHGHSFRIGSTLELLMRPGMTFEAVKIKGRWSGDSFKAYLRDHAIVLAPYIQANDRLREEWQSMFPAMPVR
jgi:hypothetical protein